MWSFSGTEWNGVSHDDPEVTPPDRIRYDACITVDERFRPPEGIATQTLPGGLYGMATHIGPYGTLGESYAQLMGRWAPRSDFIPRPGPCLEFYRNDPEGTDPEDRITDIHLPIGRAP